MAPPGWGWVDHKQRHHACASPAELLSALREDRDARVILAWTPDDKHMILPEEVAGAAEAVLASRKRTAAGDLQEQVQLGRGRDVVQRLHGRP